MRISEFHIKNYKSFLDSGKIKLSPGFNIVLGQNNSGKTALLEALKLSFQSKPHRSHHTLPDTKSPKNMTSSVDASLTISGEELKHIHINGGYTALFIPIPDDMTEHSSTTLTQVLHQLWHEQEHTFSLSFKPGTLPDPITIPTFGTYKCKTKDNTLLAAIFTANQTTHDFDFVKVKQIQLNQESGGSVGLALSNNIYAFQAERLNIASCAFGINTILTPNASNLPEVLHNLQSNNPRRFKKLNQYLKTIFPTIHEVSISPLSGNQVEIVVWTADPDSEREDLTIKLSECGTGIGQALAILYVVLTSEDSRIIIIDEPNSFLHPTASRRLIEILKTFNKHQYIISTHSPEIISIANPSTILMVSWNNSLSHIHSIDINSIENLRNALDDIGSKMSDLLGPETILWVEGPTEERCFTRIVRHIYKKSPTDIAIRPVRSTGDFENKKLPETLIWEIYERLSSTSTIFPAKIAFEFDREERSESSIKDLERRSNNKIKFLPRRTLENYFIHPTAISILLSELDNSNEGHITTETIDNWLLNNSKSKKYIDKKYLSEDVFSKTWLIKINGAKLIKDIFLSLTENRIEYKKTTHGEWITDWLLTNNKDHIADLVDLVNEIINQGSRGQTQCH